MWVLTLLGQYKREEISRIVGVCPDTVTDIANRYSEKGISAFQDPARYRPASCLEPYRAKLKRSFKKKPSPSIAEAMDRIRKLTKISLGETQVREFIKSRGMKLRKMGHVPSKADPVKQKAYHKETMLPRLRECKKGLRHTLFMDGAHFVLAPFMAQV